MSEFADVVDVAAPAEFAAAIRLAKESDSPERQEARRLFVTRYSWDSIADRLIRALENTPAT
jgi:glycosyltransferase involved in cell wall biosynthesis